MDRPDGLAKKRRGRPKAAGEPEPGKPKVKRAGRTKLEPRNREFVERARRFAKASGWSMTDLGLRAGRFGYRLNPSRFSRWYDMKPTISVWEAQAVARALNVPLAALIEESPGDDAGGPLPPDAEAADRELRMLALARAVGPARALGLLAGLVEELEGRAAGKGEGAGEGEAGEYRALNPARELPPAPDDEGGGGTAAG